MAGSLPASIHSLTHDQPIASISTSPSALAALPPILFTSGLGHVGEHGQTQGKHVPLEEPEPEPTEQRENSDETEDEDEDEVTDSSSQESSPPSPSGLVERDPPTEAPLDQQTSSDGEEGSEGETDDDDEEEPTLKYNRLGGGTTEILSKDTASALAVSKQFIVSLGAPSQSAPISSPLFCRPWALITEPSSSSTLMAT